MMSEAGGLLMIACAALLLSIFTAGEPPRESGTTYSFVDGGIKTSGLDMFSSGSAVGQACCMGNPGNYSIVIDGNLPIGLQNTVMRHENCHVRQYKSGRNMTVSEREIECYFTMWLG